MAESGGTLIDNGYESGTNGNALTTGTLTVNGGSIQYYNSAYAEGSMSARCLANGPTFGTQLDYSFSTTGELRFWHNPTTTTKSCNIFDLPGDSTSTLLMLWDSSDGNLKWYNQRAVSGLSATTYYTIGTWTTGWQQYRIVPDYSARTCRVYRRSSLTANWTQLSISSPAVSDLPMRSSSISSMPGMSFSAYNGQTLYLDSVKYGSITDDTVSTLTLSAGTCDAWGRTQFTATEGANVPSALKVYRATSSGGTYSEITSNCTITDNGSTWTIKDKRPTYGTPSIALGSTAYYKVLGTNSGTYLDGSLSSSLSIAVDVDKPTVEKSLWDALHTEMSTQATRENSTHLSHPYGAYFLAEAAYIAATYSDKTTQALSDLNTWWTYYKATNINADDLFFTSAMSGTYPYIHREFHWHAVRDLLITARVLRYFLSGNSTATSIHDDIMTSVDAMTVAGCDLLARKTMSWQPGSTALTNTTAWAAGATIAKGEVRKPTGSPTRAYRALNAGTTHASTQPTWPTTDGGTVTDNGITWKETSAHGDFFYHTYDETSPYAQSSDIVSNANPVRVTDMEAVLAAAFALLLNDGTAPSVASGGAYRPTVQALLDSHVTSMTSLNHTSGDGNWNSSPEVGIYTGIGDTNYGSYTLADVADVVTLVDSGTYPQAEAMLSRSVSWLHTNYGTEPTIANAGSIGNPNYQLGWRRLAYGVEGTTDPYGNLIWSSAFHPSLVYTQAGQATGTPSETFFAIHLYGLAWEKGIFGITTSTATYTADAIIKTVTTYTADALVVARSTATYTADAIISLRPTTTYTADAVINALAQATYTADAIIQDLVHTKTYTADAIVFGTNTLTYTADARIEAESGIASRALSWFFRRRRSNMATTKTYTQVQAKGTTRTATWTSPTYESKYEAGILVVLDVTAASGTGGLTLRINAHDLAGSVAVPLNTAPTAVTATGTTSYAVYPFGAISGALTQSTSGYLPRQFSITVTHGDSSSYTYSVGFALLP